ncbi:hypothetical protein GCM10027277_10360 [Pseudoduganella ginsengisoli]|uniref:Lipoprotein n=1 Tax=Pseudoduganella ginsengisoli TaxID=1462440 RepID=A0A6L6PXJ6_9BURK|nr:hypothetical protein [Pseudoduganella ginsengisoli]MTW01432.1 hypothetical protein [Pseudoduganella ginsengisoli]
MKIFHMMAAALLLALAACGGGSTDTPPTANPPVVTPPATMLDAFVKAVQGYLGIAPDTEPADVAGASVTEPDNTEPEKVE